jgi:hypothetical protein
MTHIAIELPDSLEYALDISLSRCTFVGVLYRDDSGGAELRLSLRGSDFEHLSTEMVTWLRQQASDQREILIERFTAYLSLFALIRRSRRSLREWAILHCGLEHSLMDRIRDSAWILILVSGLVRGILHGGWSK